MPEAWILSVSFGFVLFLWGYWLGVRDGHKLRGKGVVFCPRCHAHLTITCLDCKDRSAEVPGV